MNTQELTKQFGKKTIPDIRPGDTIRVHFKITEGGKTRIQVFEGLVLAFERDIVSCQLLTVIAGIG